MHALVTIPLNLQSAGKVEKVDQTIQSEKVDAEPDKGAKATTGKFDVCLYSKNEAVLSYIGFLQ